jgi:hypothetical protein
MGYSTTSSPPGALKADRKGTPSASVTAKLRLPAPPWPSACKSDINVKRFMSDLPNNPTDGVGYGKGQRLLGAGCRRGGGQKQGRDQRDRQKP